ncbi:GNAT family N-acetyltransferase [Acholeplasma granularum]|uniref:GNAT family N-acetyltransferase n=1 Tax=Acholeplasma granularum TaxID=264635 RepID=UPI0004728F05|nr:GNAT family N-acetyltransferase [Acholeplasma granularum]
MDIVIKVVESKKEAKAFTEFPNKLFKDVEAFVPALSFDELNVFDKVKNPAHEYCESIRFLAYRNKKIVGRIAGIINHKYNKEFETKIVRFSRIDMIDDIKVTEKLIKTIETWGHSKGMNQIIGPIGFTDMDRMGLLVEGFEYLNMFITIWNPPYYLEHLEKIGFIKDVDWIESIIPWPKELPEKVQRGAEIVRRRFGYELVKIKKIKELDKYVYDAFDVYNEAFSELYGFYPLSKSVMEYYIKQVKSLVKLDFLWFVLDKEKKVIALGLMMPSLALANKKNNGKLFPFGFIRLLRSLKKFNTIDFYFIAVDPEHQGKGVITLIMEDGIKNGIKYGVVQALTGPELENNVKIQSQWKDYNPTLYKRRRCLIKDIN